MGTECEDGIFSIFFFLVSLTRMHISSFVPTGRDSGTVEISGDLVIGADGAHSVVRREVMRNTRCGWV